MQGTVFTVIYFCGHCSFHANIFSRLPFHTYKVKGFKLAVSRKATIKFWPVLCQIVGILNAGAEPRLLFSPQLLEQAMTCGRCWVNVCGTNQTSEIRLFKKVSMTSQRLTHVLSQMYEKTRHTTVFLLLDIWAHKALDFH